MDWRSISFDWTPVRAFLVTAEEGSLSAAARALGQAQPTIGRQIAALETRLGVALFERTGHGMTLTPAGHDLLDHARLMGEGAQGLALAAHGQARTLDGRVTISASDATCAYLLPPILTKLRTDHPGLRITLSARNDLSDLRRHEADIAVRNTQPRQPDLIARKLREASARLYAARSYLKRIGPIATLADLQRADFFEIDDAGSLRALLAGRGIDLPEDRFPYTCASFTVMWDMLRRGLGVGIIDDRIGDADPLVARVLDDPDPVTFPVWLVAHRDLMRSRRLRVVWDALADGLA